MGELKAYRCPNCGNMLKVSSQNKGIYTCECCGTEYEREFDGSMGLILRPYVIKPQVETLGFSHTISGEYLETMSPDSQLDLVEHSIKVTARNIAEQLLPYIEITTERDLLTMGLVIRGRLQVVKPNSGLYDYLRDSDIRKGF